MAVDITERLRLNLDDWVFGNTARDAMKEIASLKAQLAECKKDAERYRWFREASPEIYWTIDDLDEVHLNKFGFARKLWKPEGLDQQIDAAMAQKEEA